MYIWETIYASSSFNFFIKCRREDFFLLINVHLLNNRPMRGWALLTNIKIFSVKTFFSAFGSNESHLCRYWPDVPYIDLDKAEIPEDFKRVGNRK